NFTDAGIQLDGVSSCEIIDNFVDSSEVGIELTSAATKNTLIGNRISGSDTEDGAGIKVTGKASGNFIGRLGAKANTISSNNFGILIDGAANTVIFNNNITVNDIGVDVRGASPNTVIGGATTLNTNNVQLAPADVISGNRVANIAVHGKQTVGSRIEGNFIGTDASGAVAVVPPG